jgi:hypothetical protein
MLVLIDQDMVEPLSFESCKRGLVHHVRPTEQQVIVVEDVVLLLRRDITAEELL